MKEPILQFFEWEHLPDNLQQISMPFSDMANWVIRSLPRNSERTVALRRLLEAKDAAVRAKIYKEEAYHLKACGTVYRGCAPECEFHKQESK